MNLKEIKELIKLMNENELTEIEIEKENGKIRLSKKNIINGENIQLNPYPVSMPESSEVSVNKSEASGSEYTEDVEEVLSPMVGIFYRSPAPDSDPFVEEKDEVKLGDVLCIIEAMKVMNEIKSEIKGEVVKVLVENGKQVEYNQPLFLIKKK